MEFDYAHEAGRYTHFSSALQLNRVKANLSASAIFQEAGKRSQHRKEMDTLEQVAADRMLGSLGFTYPFALLYFGFGDKTPPIPAGSSFTEFHANASSYLAADRAQCEELLSSNPDFPANMAEFFGKLGIPLDYRGLEPIRPEGTITEDSPENIYWGHVMLHALAMIESDLGRLRTIEKCPVLYLAQAMQTIQRTVEERIGNMSIVLGATAERVYPSGITAPSPEEYDIFNDDMVARTRAGKAMKPHPSKYFDHRVKSYLETDDVRAWLSGKDPEFAGKCLSEAVGFLSQNPLDVF